MINTESVMNDIKGYVDGYARSLILSKNLAYNIH
jgi:hypothetical protein